MRITRRGFLGALIVAPLAPFVAKAVPEVDGFPYIPMELHTWPVEPVVRRLSAWRYVPGVRTLIPRDLKVFAMPDDCEWWAGYSAEEVKKAQVEIGFAEPYSDDEHPVEVSEADMDRLMFCDHDEMEPGLPARRTFRQELARLYARGVKFPCFFATTEY